MTAISPDFALRPAGTISGGGGGASISTGLIVDNAAIVTPAGFLACDGSLVSRTAFAALFSAIGVAYGAGDGSTTFALPSKRAIISTITPNTVMPVGAPYKLTLLLDGRILAVGGNSAYIGTFSSTGAITWVASTAYPTNIQFGNLHTLSDGRVLYIAGVVATTVVAACYFGTISGNTITWVLGTALPATRNLFASMILQDGRILVVAGGSTYFGSNQNTTYFGTISGNTITWVAGTAYPQVIRELSGILLPDGSVLCTGGYTGSAQTVCYRGVISGNTITWTATENLPEIKSGHDTFLLPTNQILAISGNRGGSNYTLNIAIGHRSDTSVLWATDPVPAPVAMSYYGSCMSGNRLILVNNATVYVIQFVIPVIKT